jgi:hypothetical protein
MRKKNINAREERMMRRMVKWLFCAAFFTLHSSLFTPTASAQGMVTEIKVVAIQEFKDLDNQASGYSGTGDKELDFRKGRGGGYVFVLSRNSTDTAMYITDVKVETKVDYGIEYDENGKKYTPVLFFQADEHKDDNYRGGLNGRNYSIYGGAYPGQPHIYVSRTGNKDFDKNVLREVKVTTTKPKNLKSNQSYTGGHAGGGRYLVYTWHSHEPKFKPKISKDAPDGDINWHVKYCDRDQCGIEKDEPHEFEQLLFEGIDTWFQLPKTDSLSTTKHYKQCTKCKQIVYENHSWATYTSDWGSHNQRCLICDYVITANHANFGAQKLPVDENYHIIFCDSCGFLKKLRHDFSEDRFIERQDCEYTVVKLTCKQCFHDAYFEEKGVGHDYDQYGICRRKNCLHPYQQPSVEPLDTLGKDSVYVIKSYGNLYWIADYVNNRRPKANFRLANDLTADSYMKLPWHPIGATDSTAFQGTFDGGGHIISMLQTEEPVAGCGYRGLFGVIGKDATVKGVTMTSCKMRGWDNIGAVAGVNEGKITDCHVTFSVMKSIGTEKILGGICGTNKKTGTISDCTTGGDVWVGGVRDYAGGICGTNEGGTLTGNLSLAICGSGSDAILPDTASEL